MEAGRLDAHSKKKMQERQLHKYSIYYALKRPREYSKPSTARRCQLLHQATLGDTACGGTHQSRIRSHSVLCPHTIIHPTPGHWPPHLSTARPTFFPLNPVPFKIQIYVKEHHEEKWKHNPQKGNTYLAINSLIGV